jgi:ASC-1-like (ASCH) protein
MATFDAPWHPTAFEEMEAGRKTVYALPATAERSVMSSGDRLEFGSHGSITIGMVRRYPGLAALLEGEGWQCVMPEAPSAAVAQETLLALPEWAEATADTEALALRVRRARRKT